MKNALDKLEDVNLPQQHSDKLLCTALKEKFMTPERNEGTAFFNLAVAYRRSADLILDSQETEQAKDATFDLPVRFLYSHAAELFFKAFLRLKGASVSDLRTRPYGHNLANLYSEYDTRSLELNSADKQSLSNLMPLLESGHGNYQFRYFEESFNTADPHFMRDALGKLSEAVELEVKKQRQSAQQKAAANNLVVIDVPAKMIISADLRK